jgi:hypothetical protein
MYSRLHIFLELLLDFKTFKTTNTTNRFGALGDLAKHICLLGAVLSAFGCASLEPAVPQDYKGPISVLKDSGFSESPSLGVFYVVDELDGQRIENSTRATYIANYGRGLSLTPVFMERNILAKPVQVRIRATHVTGAPIQAMTMSAQGTFYSVEGTVSFEPEAGMTYIVTGRLSKENSCVWIENQATKAAVTEKTCTCKRPGPCPEEAITKPEKEGNRNTQDKFVDLGADLKAIASKSENVKALFYNTTSWFVTTTPMELTINGTMIGSFGVGEYIQLELAAGVHEVELTHWDLFTFKSKHKIDVSPPSRYIEFFGTILSNDIKVTEELPQPSQLPRKFRHYKSQ